MMYRRPEEIAALRESFRNMDTKHKLEHIYTYHKWTILLVLIAVYLLGDVVYRQVTKKEVPLYVGYVNVSIGDELQGTITDDFLTEQGLNLRKNEILVYKGLVLSNNPAPEDHQYAYASRMKVMAAVNAQKLDVVLMSGEAYNLLSGSGYLLELSGLPEILAPCLTENKVVLEDNAIEVQLNEADEYYEVTKTVVNGVDISSFSMFRDAGFNDAVYAGIITNCPRVDTAVKYLEYLAG